jgi:hypothetical protein
MPGAVPIIISFFDFDILLPMIKACDKNMVVEPPIKCQV